MRRNSCGFMLPVLAVIQSSACKAFVVESKIDLCQRKIVSLRQLGSIGDDDVDKSEIDFMNDLISRAEEIQVEWERDRLEEANEQSFLKRKPRKLPYLDARRWIQANLGPSTKEEFLDLVENGNLRTPYIPKRPEEYYTETREWVSWEHFLTGIFDKHKPSAVQPSTGIFD